LLCERTRVRIEAGAQKTDAELKGQRRRRGRFPRFIAEMCRAFVREPLDQIDRAVDAWLKPVVLRFGLGLSTVARTRSWDGIASSSHGWARRKYPVIGRPLDANVLTPWLRKKMLAEEVAVSLKVGEFRAKAEFRKRDRDPKFYGRLRRTACKPSTAHEKLIGGNRVTPAFDQLRRSTAA